MPASLEAHNPALRIQNFRVLHKCPGLSIGSEVRHEAAEETTQQTRRLLRSHEDWGLDSSPTEHEGPSEQRHSGLWRRGILLALRGQGQENVENTLCPSLAEKMQVLGSFERDCLKGISKEEYSGGFLLASAHMHSFSSPTNKTELEM